MQHFYLFFPPRISLNSGTGTNDNLTVFCFRFFLKKKHKNKIVWWTGKFSQNNPLLRNNQKMFLNVRKLFLHSNKNSLNAMSVFELLLVFLKDILNKNTENKNNTNQIFIFSFLTFSQLSIPQSKLQWLFSLLDRDSIS